MTAAALTSILSAVTLHRMPYRLTQEPTFLRIALSGQVSLADLQGALGQLEALEATQTSMQNRLVDLTAVQSSELVGGDIFAVAERRKAKTYPNAFRTAVVAPQPAQFGFARMFQTLNNHPFITIRVVTEEAEAVKWLETGQAD